MISTAEMYQPLILLVDDQEHELFSYCLALRKSGYKKLLTCTSGDNALNVFEKEKVGVVVLDLTLPGISGQELLQRLTEMHPGVPVIILTGIADTDTIVQCMRWGAFDYLIKPVDANRLTTTVKKACEFRGLRAEIHDLKSNILKSDTPGSSFFGKINTSSSRMRQLFRYAESVAVSNHPVLITGETGVGKELFARSVHDASGRPGPFVAINISGLDDAVFSDTLFGHRKGAYTGADSDREGLLARAAGGTLFLDEIGDLEMRSQLKLLRLLQEGEYYPLGEDKPRQMRTRIVAATNCDLSEMIQRRDFRNDLYYRLSSHSLHIPALRERIQDLPLLLEHFVAQSAAELRKKIPCIAPTLHLLLAQYSFPGNIRELKGMVHDAVAQHREGPLTIECFSLPATAATARQSELAQIPQTAGVSFAEFPTLKVAEEYLIMEAMVRAHGVQSKAAAILGITRQALSQRLAKKKG